MAYCQTTDVQGRAGALLDNLTANPSSAELGDMIADTAAIIDGYLSGLGVAIPTTDTVAMAALKPTNADGALVLALEARFVGTSGPGAEPAQVLVGARARWMAALKSLEAGTHPAQVALTQSTGLGIAGSFHADEADAYTPDALSTTAPLNTNTQATVYEGMHL